MPLIEYNLDKELEIQKELRSQREKSPGMRMLRDDDSDYSWTSDEQNDKGLKSNIFKQ